MDAMIERTLESLQRRLIKGWAAANSAEARHIVGRVVPRDAVVGIGDSSTVRQIVHGSTWSGQRSVDRYLRAATIDMSVRP